VAVATRLATIHNYKDELSGEAREREDKKDNQAVATPSIPQEIQCAVFLTVSSPPFSLRLPCNGLSI